MMQRTIGKMTYMTRAISVFTAITVVLSLVLCCAFPVAADEVSDGQAAVQSPATTPESSGDALYEDYAAYKAAHADWNIATEDAAVSTGATTLPATLSAGIVVELTVDAPQNALYEIELLYRCLTNRNAAVSFIIDGEVAFPLIESANFPAFWVNDGGVRTDDNGNEFAPDQKLSEVCGVSKARDYSGQQEYAYRFALTAGVHTIKMEVAQGSMWLEGVSVVAPQAPEAYKAPADHQANDKYVVIQGEDATLKNDRVLISLSDGSSAYVAPNDPVLNKINYIGGANWGGAGQAITWDFTIETAGYYSVDFLYRQNQLIGGTSYRRMLIDGKIPFAEAERIPFDYGSSWATKTLGSDTEAYLIWLEAGPHTMTLEATPALMALVFDQMKVATAKMGALYVEITKLIGETVDIYRSYELFNQIPGFNDSLQAIIDDLDIVIATMQSMQSSENGSSVSTVQTARRVVQEMLDKPYSAHKYKSQFYDNFTNLSALMGTMTSMPLDIDRIVIKGENAEVTDLHPTWWQNTVFGMKRFLASFSNDYQGASGDNEEALTLWITWGRDQAQVVNALIQDDFVRNYNIPVRVELVNATLIQAVLSGSGPDCMLQMTRTEPVNMAMRGVLVDLSDETIFKDREVSLEEVLSRFSKNAELPYRYNGGLYALPDTQNFFAMFARTDIMETLELEIPETWDEFVYAAQVLQRNNLQVSIPYTSVANGASNTGVGGTSLYPTLLAQKGLSLYKDDLSGVAIAQKEQIEVFNEWISWYKTYNLPVVTDFFNRFRVGSAPLGIGSYTLYTQLQAAAPEIAGRWVMTEIPGTVIDGEINNATTGAGTGCAITTLSKNPQNAWKFLEWWTQADTQVKFSGNVESVLGPLGRVAVSNTEALRDLGWDYDIAELLVNAKDKAVEIPEVPGGYYTARGIDQAYWGAIEQSGTTADLLIRWAEVVDREIERKTEEYANK